MALLVLRLVIAGAVLYALYQIYHIVLNGMAIGKMRRIAAERGDMSGLPHFQVAFPDWPSDKLRAVYTRIQDTLALDDFPLFPDDKLIDLGLYEKDVLEMTEELIQSYGGQKNLPAEPLQTARDVVNYIGKATPSEGTSNGTL